MALAITRDDSATIGFVVACLFADAIDKSELRAWADHVLIGDADCPLYIVNLGQFNEPSSHIYRVIGFVPGSKITEAERMALVGIAVARGREPFEPIPTKEQAKSALAANPQVAVRFRDTFPFLPFEWNEPLAGSEG